MGLIYSSQKMNKKGKVWHDGLIYKLKSYEVEGKPLNLIQNYLTISQQRVLLNGRTSKWTNILSEVPQGSVLGPLFFSIYIHDLPDVLKSICKIFPYDTPLMSKINDTIQAILTSATI